MFTGIIETTGTLVALQRQGSGAIITVKTPTSFNLRRRVALGDSIANNGVCLTVTALDEDCFNADLSAETMHLTCFQYYVLGTRLNLELACTPQTHLGGHLVQGHVDGIGQLKKISSLDEAFDVYIQVPSALLPYIAPKGSISVDGVSLTVNAMEQDLMRLTIIPHTQSLVNFEDWRVGTYVNLEVDVIARYLERLLQFKPQEHSSKLSFKTLVENGFV